MKKLSKELIDDISYETGIASSHIEKDWYLVYVLDIIKSLNTDTVKAVFAGGTSLSKGYHLISRFSEDVDFSIVGLENADRKTRSRYRKSLIQAINETDILSVDIDSVQSRDENRYTTFYINYPKEFSLDSGLRHNLKLELSFRATYLAPETKEIRSFANNYIKEAFYTSIDCISIIETAANKFNALMWRIDIRDRNHPINHQTNDPSLVRHLHDLGAMFHHIHHHQDFKQLVEEIFQIDKTRGNKTREISLTDFIENTLHKLKTDKFYEAEYSQFVSTMSFDLDNELSYYEALEKFEALCRLFV